MNLIRQTLLSLLIIMFGVINAKADTGTQKDIWNIPESFSYSWIEAEDGKITHPMTISDTLDIKEADGRNKISGKFITVSEEENIEQASASYYFYVNDDKNYFIWARAYMPATDRDTFYYSVDGAQPSKVAIQLNNFTWRKLVDTELSKGWHTLTITCDKPNVVIDKFLITDNSFFTPRGCDASTGYTVENINNTENVNFRVIKKGSNSLKLAWNVLPEYQDCYFAVFSDNMLLNICSSEYKNCLIENLVPDKDYEFTLKIFNPFTNETYVSDPVVSQTYSSCPEPQEINLLTAEGGNGRVTLRWEVPDDDYTTTYAISRNGEFIYYAEAEDGYYEDLGLTSGVEYEYSVTALNAAGQSSKTTNVSARVNPFINVKQAPYFAKGDGVTDDTLALQSAFHDYAGSTAVIYIPDGKYLISNYLEFSDYVKKAKRLVIIGESQENTIIQLKDNLPQYQDKNNPSYMIDPYSGPGGLAGDGSRDEINYQAFHNSFRNITFDTGKGNPGIVAVRWTNNNQGGLENVTIRSGDGSGFIGLDLSKEWTGPGFMKNVLIDGFDYGVYAANTEYNMVFEDLTLQNQKIAGIKNKNYPMVIRNLKSSNNVPVLINEDDPPEIEFNGEIVHSNRDTNSLITITDAQLEGSGSCAIQNISGAVFLRNIKSTGYTNILDNGKELIGTDIIDEYSSLGVQSAFENSSDKSLNLEFVKTPQLSESLTDILNSDDFVYVTDFGAIPQDNNDDTEAIQKAIDSGKKYIIFPNGNYNISDTIYIRQNVNALIGLETTLTISSEPAFTDDSGNDTGVFNISDTSADFVLFEGFCTSGSYLGGPVLFLHAQKTPLVLRHISNHINASAQCMAYKNTVEGGSVFIEDISYPVWYFNGQKVYAKQFNPECQNMEAKVINNGSDVVILGYKAEGNSTEVISKNGARTEIVGGSIYPASGRPSIYSPAFITTDSQLSVNIAEAVSGQDPARSWTLWFKDTVNGETRIVDENSLPKRVLLGNAIGLYTSYTKQAIVETLYLDGIEYPYFKFTAFEQNIPWSGDKPPKITAEAFNGNAVVSIKQADTLSDKATITVSEGGLVNTYEISFLPSSDADITALKINIDAKGNYVSMSGLFGFDKDKTDYTFYVAQSEDGAYNIPQIYAKPSCENASVVIEQPKSIPGKATVTVTAQDNKTTKTYTIDFKIASSDNALLSSIRVWNCYLEDFTPDKTEYSFTLHTGIADSNHPGVAAVAQNANAKVSVQNADNINGKATITVTSADETVTKTYTVSFSAIDSNVSLSEIKINGTLINGFSPDITSYTVPYESNMSVTAKSHNTSADVEVSETENGYIISVTPEHKLFTKEYYINYSK